MVLFIVDGLGYHALCDRRAIAPNLHENTISAITSVVPTTTPTALTSITTATPPGTHGILGQRLPVRTARGDWREYDVLRSQWVGYGATSTEVPPSIPARVGGTPFGADRPYVISKRKHLGTGFSTLHLGADPNGVWKMPSGIPVEAARALRESRGDVYVYYDGLDTTAHHHGFGPHYDAELAYVDSLFMALADVLPSGARLVVTGDHGCVPITRYLNVPAEITRRAEVVGGEDRNIYLIARPGDAVGLAADARVAFGDLAWVFSGEEAIDAGLFGPRVHHDAVERVGDVRIFPFAGYGFRFSPIPGGSVEVEVCGHGSLTAEELLVPLIDTSKGAR